MLGRRSFSLKFPDPAEEASFQLDLAKALLPIIRLGLIGGLWLWPAVGLAVLLLDPPNPLGVVVIATFMFVVNILTLLLLRTPKSLERIESIGAVVCALSGVSVILTVPVAGRPDLSVFVVPGLMIVAIYAFVVFQLPPLPGLAAAAVFLAAYVVAPLQQYSPVTYVLNLLMIGTVLGLGAMAAYFLERSMRDRYRQSRLIEAQAVEIAEEQAKSDRLLRNVLPARIAARLRRRADVAGRALRVGDRPLLGPRQLYDPVRADRAAGDRGHAQRPRLALRRPGRAVRAREDQDDRRRVPGRRRRPGPDAGPCRARRPNGPVDDRGDRGLCP